MPQPRLVMSINSAWNFVNFRRGLVRALQQQGFELVAVAPDDGYADAVRELGCRFVPLPIDSRGKSPLADARLIARYRRILRDERPLAYLGYTIKPNIYGALAAQSLGIPVINNVAGLGTAFLRGGWLNRLVRLLYRLALRRSHTIFFQNREDLALFLSLGLVPPERASLLPGSGVDLEQFVPAADDERPSDRFVFLLCARLLWSKGVGDYVRAAESIRATWPSAVFRILGIVDEEHPDGISRSVIDGWSEAGVIEYLGRADDVRPHLADADCVVLPSFYPEGTPRSLLEAAAMGKPLIATDVPGCRDVVDDRRNGYLCAPRDALDLAAKMEAMLRQPVEATRAMGLESRHRAVTEFDEKIVISRYLAAVDSIKRAGEG